MFEEKGSTRQKLAFNLIEHNYFTDALDQMNILMENGQLDYELMLERIKYKIYKGVGRAEITNDIKTAREINPFDTNKLNQSLGLNYVLDGDVTNAERTIKELIDQDLNVNQNYYTLARLKVNNGKEKDGLKYLKKAIENGFQFSWVVDRDASWNDVRETKKFLELRNRLPASIE